MESVFRYILLATDIGREEVAAAVERLDRNVEEVCMEQFFHVLFPSAYGELCLVWKETENGPRVVRLFLSSNTPNSSTRSVENLIGRFSASLRKSCPKIENFIARIYGSLEGDVGPLSPDLLDFSHCTSRQKAVLLEEHTIPRGTVSTYGRLAAKAGMKNGARAAGSALARNPFPIIIPCHRVVRANGDLGGYQGGNEMKRKLLEDEGIRFSSTGKVLFP